MAVGTLEIARKVPESNWQYQSEWGVRLDVAGFYDSFPVVVT